MPRDIGTGLYHYPDGTPGNPAQTIFSTRYNTFINDLANTMNQKLPINMGGTDADNATDARANLGAEVAGQAVTNYDTHVFENGSFRSAAGATGAPNGGVNAFMGTALVLAPDQSFVVLEARDVNDTTQPGRKYVREKDAGVWGAWKLDGRTTIGTGEGISNETADMFFGLGGTSPNSAFIVNSESDASGQNLFVVNRTGATSLGPSPAAGGNGQLMIQKSGTANGTSAILYGAEHTGKVRWAIQLGNETVESGSNAGSDFAIQRFDDAGTFLGTPLNINRANGELRLVNTLWVGSAGTTGLINFGNTGTKNLQYDGTNYGLNGGNLSISSNILTVGISGATGIVNFGNTGSKNFQYDGAAFAVNGGSFYVNAGNVSVNGGYQCRQGVSGAFGSNHFNLCWVGGGDVQMWIDTTNLGIIAYTSDYRIKKDVVDLPGMWDTVKALRPIKYTQAQFTPPSDVEHKLDQALADRKAGLDTPAAKPGSEFVPMYEADDIERWGFIAHELQETLIETAASGTKDAPDTIQSPNPFTLIAALTKALQEAMARIEALEAAQAVP